jgi:chromosome segregation ATPase
MVLRLRCVVSQAQRDEMDDQARANRNQISDLEDSLRRVKAQLASAHEQAARVPPLQSKVDACNEQVMQLTHESKVLATEVGVLQAENARLTLKNSQEPVRSEQHNPPTTSQHAAEALQYKIENDRLRLEVESKSRELEAQLANMKVVEGRKDFLSKSLMELEDHVSRLSGQVHRERSLGTTDQRIADMRRLVPHWRWEAMERSDRTIDAASPPRLDMLSHSFNSSFCGNSLQR